MDRHSSFYENISERLRSPLVFSFLISWLIVNWRIPVYLLWYNPSFLKENGKLLYIEYVSSQLNTLHALVWPLSLAILYTFGFPYVKNIISKYNTIAVKKGSQEKLAILGDSVISFEKYDSKVKMLKQREQELVEMIKKENEVIDRLKSDNADLAVKMNKTSDLLNTSENQLNELNERFSISVLDLKLIQAATDINQFSGVWKVQIENEKVEWQIDGANVRELNDQNSLLTTHSIEFSYWRKQKDSRIVMMLHLMGDEPNWKHLFPKHRMYCYLRSNAECTLLTGNTSEGYKIMMRKL
jgi:hypothetical protein